MYKYLDNEEQLHKVFGIDTDIEHQRLEEIANRKEFTNTKCYVCKNMFEAYCPKTRKCSKCELDNRANV